MRSIIGLLIVVAVLSFSTPPVAAQQPDTTPQWSVHVDPEGKFVVMMPGTPEEFVEKNNYESGLHFRRVKLPTESYFILFGDYATTRYDMRTMLNKERDGIARLFKLTPVSQKTALVKHGTRELLTIEFNADSDDGKAHYIWRVFFRDQRAYSMGIGAAKETDINEQAKLFLNSFVLIE